MDAAELAEACETLLTERTLATEARETEAALEAEMCDALATEREDDATLCADESEALAWERDALATEATEAREELAADWTEITEAREAE